MTENNCGCRDIYDGSRALEDALNVPVSTMVEAMRDSGVEIIFMSGRSDEFREVTEEWLDMHGFGDHELHMRAHGDQRKDSIVKHELFWNEVADRYNVIGAVDDRNQVVDLWRSMGITCFQVNYGDF